MFKMKYSGIKSIGNIPHEWNIKKCKYITKFVNGYAFDSNAMQKSGKYPIIRIGDINGETIDLDNCLYVDDNVGLKKYKIRKDDLLLAMSGATVGKTGYSYTDQDAYINQRVGIIRSLNNRFINYYLKTEYFQEYVNLISVGSAQPNISSTNFGEFKISTPDIKEQKLIADFLDEKVDIIDNIICDLNNQIEILNKYKNQLISEVVTSGLNKKVAMKDSEVEWIGSIPEHWNIKLIKNICSLKGRIGWEGLTKDEYISEGPTLITGINFDNGNINWDNCEHVSEWRYNQDKSIQIKNKDLLITKDGTVGKVAIVKDCPEKVTLNSGVLLLRPLNNEYIEKYLYYVLLSNEFWHWFEIENIGNTTIIHLYQNRFAKFKLALPPIDEQKEIANYLDKKCSEIDEILSSKMKQKEQMEQYKKSVIYEYVTGKKRVEGAEELYG